MKKTSEKIAKVLSLAASEERRIGQQTGRSQQALSESQQRLQELQSYRSGYATKQTSAENVNAAHWCDYQRFLQRLDEAVSSQHQVVRNSEANLKLHRDRWMAKRRRLESLERALDRHTRKERNVVDRLEQKQQDEMAARKPASDEQRR